MANGVQGAVVARDDRSVKIERRIADEAARVALHRGITAAEYLSELLRGQVHRDYLAALKAEYEAAQQAEERPKGKR